MTKPVPTIDIAALGETGAIPDGMRNEVITALNAYPYFAVLTGRAPERSPNFITALATSLTMTEAERAALTVTLVAHDPSAPKVDGRATSFSTTADELEAHTDSSFMPRPHEFVAFQFKDVDPVGGDTIILPVDDVLARLSAADRAAARGTEFFFGNSFHPILTGDAGRPSIRFYRVQPDQSAGGALIRPDRIALADAVSAAAAARHEDYRFHAKPGQTVLINNTKCLHSRTAFDPTSNRMMFRVRAHTPLIH